MDLIEQIKERVTIEHVCNQAGIEINRSGFIKGFNRKDNNPSLKIYTETNSYYDHGSASGGSVIDFYMECYNVDIQTAVRDLAKVAGLDPSDKGFRFKPIDNVVKKADDKIKNVLDDLTIEEKYFVDERVGMEEKLDDVVLQIKRKRIGVNARIFEELCFYCFKKYNNNKEFIKYLESRCITRKSIERFDLFFIGNYNEASNHMKKVFSVDWLIRSGLFNAKGNMIFFNHRIVIPYKYKYNIVYLRARYFDQDNNSETDQNKYLGLRNDKLGTNTPKRFYNYDAIAESGGGKIFVTEGEFDAIIISQYDLSVIGIPGVTNIPSITQLRLLKNNYVVMVTDNDEPGIKLSDGLSEQFNKLKIKNGLLNYNGKDINQTIMELKNDRGV